ncbi:hypothetical protein UAJ10_29190 [Nitrospirillum sp. BR 11164]|uniref:hypothetical protein n=1 Tax=Nitrospirillum sp. BR 11164 TaxID=3104324 RepID=UPI002AFE9F08|nr:hypothetical protein [Nitrospirillum sp. BR 11164]MEA1653078.1 hypothetical protein [Nitrospirillum sp. BR 11164]
MRVQRRVLGLAVDWRAAALAAGLLGAALMTAAGASAQSPAPLPASPEVAPEVAHAMPVDVLQTQAYQKADPHHGLARRRAAVAAAAGTDAACREMGDFYWEIGDGSGTLASGARGSRYSANKPLQVASASKLVFAAYVVERVGGQLTPDQLDALEMRSGYDNFNPLACFAAHTVAACLDRRGNGLLNAEHQGRFSYNGGHDQHLATALGLGDLDRYGLAAEVRRVLGPDLHLDYAAPRVSGGLKASPAAYAAFLRKVVSGHLRIHDLLGSHPVCTQGPGCPAVQAPDLPQPWHYSLNHWVEDGPGGDGAFSSPGMMGFYPWISADRRTYGLIAREVMAPKAYLASMACGQALRRAWAD